MNAYIHSEISVKKRGGAIADYYAIHDFADCSKEVESSNAHRLYFHTMWGVKNVVIPIFGHTIKNSDGKQINVKDLCENDHILPDYSGKFIPTLSDFIDCVKDIAGIDEKIETFYKENSEYFGKNPAVKDLMMSPLWNTGTVKSLLVTHNSWFIGAILPKIFKDITLPTADFNIAPSLLFNNITYQTWMQNGLATPPSCDKLNASRAKNKKVVKPVEFKPLIIEKTPPIFEFPDPVTYDGSRHFLDNKTID